MHRASIIFMSVLFMMGLVVFSPAATLAQTQPAAKPATAPKNDCPRGQKGQCIQLENPLQGNTTDVTVILGWIIKAALGLMGSLALFMLIWGGFQWLTSAGNPERVESGTQTMIWAAIGVVVVLSSYLIVTTYLDYLTGVK